MIQEKTKFYIAKIRIREASDEAEALENLLRDGEVADAFSLKKAFNFADLERSTSYKRLEERVVYIGGLDRKTTNAIVIVFFAVPWPS